jgi:hypothetical protein
MLQHYDRMSRFFHTYGRAEYREGFKLRGLAIKEYPRWPTRSIPAEDLAIYDQYLKQVLTQAQELRERYTP